MSAFIEVTDRDTDEKVLINSDAIASVLTDDGRTLVIGTKHARYLTETYEEVRDLLGFAGPIAHLIDGKAFYLSLP